jgi:hypothetical protein
MDAPKSIDEFTKRINQYINDKLPDNNDLFAFMRIMLNKINIRITFNKGENGIRYILSIFKPSNKRSQLQDYANGLVFAIIDDKCKILSVPTRECTIVKDLPQSSNIQEDHDEFKIYPILDGCNLTMYFDHEWRFSTTRSIDIRDMKWRGHSYREIINDMIKIDYDKLNKHYCYHLRMKNNKLHPYRPNVNFVALQSTYDLVNMAPVDCAIDGIASVVPNSDPKKRVFGCIIKYTDPNKPDIMWESDLRRFIKKCVYDTPNIENDSYKKIVFELYNKENFYVIYNYMDKVNREKFKQLFPSFAPIYESVDKVIADTISLFLGDKSITDPAAIRLFKFTSDKLQKRIKNKNKQIATDYLMDSTNTVAVYNALYDESY